jgi:DNA-binding NarL/FixJ family response regulator
VSPQLQKSRVIFAEKQISMTTLQERKKIQEGLKSGKTYRLIAEELNLTIRVVRKWGQKIKKNNR